MTAIVDVNPGTISLSYASTDPVEHLDIDTAVRDLSELREIRTALADWEYLLTTFVADYLGRNAMDLESVGHVEVKRGVDRKEWDRQGLIRAVLDSRRDPDPVTGEMVGSDSGRAVIGDEFLSCSQDLARILDVWNLGAPRVTSLRERGIDPDEFCTSTAGKVSVVIT
jgi:hypothetical protein